MGGRHLDHDWFPRPLPCNVEIGPRSWVYSSYAFLHYQSERRCGVRIGHDTGIYRGSFFELGPDGEVDIGNYCALVGAIVHSNRRVVIGDYAFIAHEVTISDGFAPVPWLKDPNRPSAPLPEKSVVIGENAWIGARAMLLGGADIGANAIVGAAAVVDFKVPRYAIVAGNPARIVGHAGS